LECSTRHHSARNVQAIETKKLTEAGYHLAIGGSQQDKQDLEDELALAGLVLPDRFENDDSDFVVFYDAKLALEIFFAVQTQWNYSMDGITGLNYQSVIAVIALYSKKRHRLDLLHEIRAIESGFLKAINEKRQKN
jgi:hypothetical protein